MSDLDLAVRFVVQGMPVDIAAERAGVKPAAIFMEIEAARACDKRLWRKLGSSRRSAKFVLWSERIQP